MDPIFSFALGANASVESARESGGGFVMKNRRFDNHVMRAQKTPGVWATTGVNVVSRSRLQVGGSIWSFMR